MCDGFSEAMVGTTMLNGAVVGSEAAGLAGTVAGVTTTSGLIGTGGAITAAGAMSGASMASTLLSGGMQAAGMIQTGQAQAASAKYNAAVAGNNAIIARQNADLALQQGQVAEQAQRPKTAQLIGSQRTAMAANGVTLDSGSALDVQSSAAMTGELDALTIRSNALRTSQNYVNQANGYDSSGDLLNAQAAWASSTSETGSIGSLLGTVGNVSNKWLKWQLGTYGNGKQQGKGDTGNADA